LVTPLSFNPIDAEHLHRCGASPILTRILFDALKLGTIRYNLEPGIGCIMIGYTVLTQITNVIDGETDRLLMMATAALA